MPAHPVALDLIRRAGVPVAAPSANVFGHISPTSAAHVLYDLDGRIDAVLDAGPTAHGVESTVLDPSQNPFMIYRPGAITLTQIEDTVGPAQIFRTAELVETPRDALPSPGVGLRHYAPKARLILVDAAPSEMGRRFVETAAGAPIASLGLMLPLDIELPRELAEAEVFPWGRWSAPEELARNLYAGLRELDARGCTRILCPMPPADGIGAAIRDRLVKAGKKEAGDEGTRRQVKSK
jgi:L-threonylcarbamoyladenylate synthase